tara:strand:+ start:9 stop:341 length:333 start_codon:yes stop_codon:yes gene_type:complete
MFKGVKIDLITIYLTNTPIITNLPCIKMNVYATRSLILSELEKIHKSYGTVANMMRHSETLDNDNQKKLLDAAIYYTLYNSAIKTHGPQEAARWEHKLNEKLKSFSNSIY